MKLLDAMDQLKSTSEEEQQRFEAYFEKAVKKQLLPFLADLSIVISIVGCLLFLLQLIQTHDSIFDLPPIHYSYLFSVLALGLANRKTGLRYLVPAPIYLLFIMMSTYTYLGFVYTGGNLAAIFGQIMFLSSLGLVTVSLFHTGVILLVNLVVLIFASHAVDSKAPVNEVLMPVVSNWFFLMTYLIAPLSAIFTRWLLRHLFALQFLLDDRNSQLTETLKTLKSTESQLIAQHKNRALNHMSASLLHEILNPLNCATQALNFAKKRNEQGDLEEVLGDIETNQKRIVSIINDLRDFSSAEPEREMEKVKLVELIEQSLTFCSGELKDIEVTINAGKDVSLLCYPSSINQVIVNLLLNAAGALHKSDDILYKQISISVTPVLDKLEIKLCDNGPGIPADQLSRLGEPFYTVNRNGKNLGLGLGICQTIMRHHQGELHIESELGVGSCVVLSLPLSRQ